ncbi:MAG: hypothetical protein Q7U59_02500 [Lutibacter sp.]|nr:hypothetical protein [Lutibacter sp.]
MNRALQILPYKEMTNGEPACPAGRQHLYHKKIKVKQMKRAITNFDTHRNDYWRTASVPIKNK